MNLPDFIAAFPKLDLPLPESQVGTRAMRSEDGLAVFFTAHQEVVLPEHSHGAQWGTVLHGALHLTRNGATETFRPGQSYSIAAGEPHAVRVDAGSVVLDIFAEPDRYPLKT